MSGLSDVHLDKLRVAEGRGFLWDAVLDASGILGSLTLHLRVTSAVNPVETARDC